MDQKTLRMNLQFFADEEPQADDTHTAEEPENKPEQNENIVQMTQEELNALIAREKGRVKNKYSDYDDLRAKAEQYEKEAEERRLAELSEKERAEELAKKFEEEKQTLAQQLEEFKAQVEQEKIRNAFITKAQAAGIAYVDDALSLADLSAVKVEDGKVSGIDDVINSLIEHKSFLLGKETKQQPKPIGGSSNPDTSGEIKTLEAQLEDARKSKNFTKVVELSNKIKQKLMS